MDNNLNQPTNTNTTFQPGQQPMQPPVAQPTQPQVQMQPPVQPLVQQPIQPQMQPQTQPPMYQPQPQAQSQVQPQSAATPPDKKEAPKYSLVDIVFAWISYIFGYLFCRAFPVFENPFGGFLFILTAFITTIIVLKIKKAKLTGTFLFFGISAMLTSATLIISGSELLTFFAYAYAIVSYCYFVYAAFENTLENGISDLIFIDYFKSVFVLPFCSFGRFFQATSHGKAKIGTKLLLKIFFGILIALIPTIIVVSLLSYDEGFTTLLKNIFDFDFSDIFSHIGSLILALPIGMYIFGLFNSSSKKMVHEKITANGCKKGFEKIRKLPEVTALTAVLPILFLYVVYFISQWQYYISGFTGILPENFSYAEYAREGFFQLCTVSVINLIIIMTIVLFMKRKTDKPSVLLKILTVIFCIFTLVLISTAVAKLAMYIDCYGLTQKRIYAMWLMAVIAIVYIIIAVGQFVSRFKSVFTSIAVCVVLFSALSLCNINEIIAEYNVNRYLNGTLQSVDISAMDDLGDSAIPACVHLAEELEAQKAPYAIDFYRDLTDLLEDKAYDIKSSDSSIFSFTIPTHKAKVALTRYGLIEW